MMCSCHTETWGQFSYHVEHCVIVVEVDTRISCIIVPLYEPQDDLELFQKHS